MNYKEEILSFIDQEKKRQENTIELIASENFCSKDIRNACGSILTNKYAEGYPKKRYYSGCEFVDEIEQRAIDLAKKLFKSDVANVQPHSGSNANIISFFSVLNPKDKIFGMSLDAGGHLTHGFKLNASGINYEAYQYSCDENGFLDYDQILKEAQEINPKLIICGASAYPRKIDFKKFREIADSCNAYLMADMAHIAGLVATGLHDSPVPYADIVTSTTHKTLRGPRGGFILAKEDLESNINRGLFPGFQGGPLEHIIAGKAICFAEALEPSFLEYQKQVLKNAKVLEEELLNYGFDLVTGGTDNHLLLLDLRKKGISGKKAQILLESAGISVNKNAISNDPKPPSITSGIRIGTPAITTRGCKEEEMRVIAKYIYDVLSNPTDERLHKKIKTEISNLLINFPLP